LLTHPDDNIKSHVVETFGTEAIKIAEGTGNRATALKNLYHRQLNKAAKFVRYFEMRDRDGRLVYLPMFLELSAATGARRGEVLSLRWSDVDGNDVLIARSLTQTRQGLEFKGLKQTDRDESACPSRSWSLSKSIEKSKTSSAGNSVPTTAPT
jgi:integrase